jgi:hypothetical protein
MSWDQLEKNILASLTSVSASLTVFLSAMNALQELLDRSEAMVIIHERVVSPICEIFRAGCFYTQIDPLR